MGLLTWKRLREREAAAATAAVAFLPLQQDMPIGEPPKKRGRPRRQELEDTGNLDQVIGDG